MYRLFIWGLLINLAASHFWHGGHHNFGHGFGPGFGPNHAFGWGHEHEHGFGNKDGPGWDHGMGWGGWHNHPNNHQQSDFDNLVQYVDGASKILQNTCNKNLNIGIRELIGMNFYALRYNLQEFTEDSIAIMVKNNVMSVTASRSSVEFKDLRILPHFVKVRDATWYYEGGELRILFPYKNPLNTEVALICDIPDNALIKIPKHVSSINDLRFLGSTEDEHTKKIGNSK